jgi:uncharacterized protein (TIGR00251 family)
VAGRAEWQGGRVAERQKKNVRRSVLQIHVQPRASKTELVGQHGAAIKIRVQALPVGGAANAELLQFLAKTLGIPRSSVRLTGGASGRLKRVEIIGLEPSEIEKLLGVC